MAKKSKPKEPEPEEIEEEMVTCPVCGKPVGLTVASCPHCGAEFEEETEEAPEVKEEPEEPVKVKEEPSAPVVEAAEPVSEEETAECPVCGKQVSLTLTTCPSCGAEFEAEEVEEVIEQPAEEEAVIAAKPEAEPVADDEMAECPVCGRQVSLSLSTCPNCGAEFEEEEVEEVIEVEEKPVPAEEPEVKVEEPQETEEEVRVEEAEWVAAEHPASIVDLRVIGVSLILLGIIGSQISALIDWYWTWVPPIETHIGMFVGIAAVVIVAGLVVYMLVRRALGSGKKVPSMMPNMSLSLLLFGILALVMIMLWSPINSALQHSSLGVAGAFLGVLIVGILSMIMGQRMYDKQVSAA